MRTEPHLDIWRVSPEERANSSSHLHRLIDGQPLERLQVEAAVVKVTRHAFVLMNTLPLAKHLLHRNACFLAPQPRKIYANGKTSGFARVRELLWQATVSRS